MDQPLHYTHAEWRVTPGREDEFIEAWRRLADLFAGLQAPPLWGSLLRSELEPTVFYSFGPWPSAEAVAAMRADPEAQAALAAVAGLCDSSSPGPCRLVVHLDVAGRAESVT